MKPCDTYCVLYYNWFDVLYLPAFSTHKKRDFIIQLLISCWTLLHIVWQVVINDWTQIEVPLLMSTEGR